MNSSRVILGFACVPLLASRADAVPPAARVLVTASRDVQALAAPLEERMRRRGIPLEIRQESAAPAALLDPAAPSRDLLLRVWIDLDNPSEARLLFAHPTRGRFAIRRVELPRGFDEVARESIAMVVDAAVGSLIEGATLELTRAEAERVLAASPAKTRAPAPTAAAVTTVAANPSAAPPREGFAAGLFYGIAVFAPGAIPLQHGPGLALSRQWARTSIELTAQYLLEVEASRRPLDARFVTVVVRAGAARRLGCAQRACLHLGAQLGVDTTWVTPTGTEEERALPNDPFTVLSPMARIATALRFSTVLGAPALVLAVDGDLLGSRYAVERAGAHADVVSPWRLRPGVAVELGWR